MDTSRKTKRYRDASASLAPARLRRRAFILLHALVRQCQHVVRRWRLLCARPSHADAGLRITALAQPTFQLPQRGQQA